MASKSVLFSPLRVGNMELSNRIAMAPLTRYRNSDSHAPQDVAAEYYGQRASYPGTLLITEATFVAAKAGSYTNAPGIYTEEQITGWKKVVDTVHAKGSYLFLQQWSLGRAADGELLRKETGEDVHSSSDIGIEGREKPRAMTLEEIKAYPGYFAESAKNFVEKCGGDGVEIHNANGYLPDQFLQTNSNKRDDAYGGSVENRCRFPLAIVDAVVKAIGEERVGIRISPYSTFQGMKMGSIEEIHETFSYFVQQIKDKYPKFAYLHVVESRIGGSQDIPSDKKETLDFLHGIWSPRPFLIAGGFKRETAVAAAEEYENSVVVFGRYFISNPDLVERIKQGVDFTEYNRDTFYLKGPEQTRGYTDYPVATK
ncbi:hypothetical protein JCM5353_003739 [Sporobolomyces roseus]